jgi:hypothetical protein
MKHSLELNENEKYFAAVVEKVIAGSKAAEKIYNRERSLVPIELIELYNLGMRMEIYCNSLESRCLHELAAVYFTDEVAGISLF